MHPMQVAALLPALLGLVVTFLPGSTAAAQEALDLRSCRTDYVIRASVDIPEHRLTGEAEVTWHNRSGDTVSELYFHLYHNAFTNNRSTHLSENSRRSRKSRKSEDWGWQELRSIKVGGADLLPSLKYGAPGTEESDGTFASDAEGREFEAEDRSVFRVDLTKPVPPGESIVIELTWDELIPRVRRRTGHRDDFLFMAHWFPKLGVYEGGRGWNCHYFHANTEFYADYGSYDVTLDLPAEYKDHVMASGVLESSRVSGERLEVRFIAPSVKDQERADATGKNPLVHGFAWTADPDFVPRQFTFSYDEWAAKYPEQVAEMKAVLGEGRDPRVRDVEVTVMIQPEREAQAERHFEATAAALFFYGLWFGEYPYEHITVVDPAWGGGAAGGMEYPTLFTAGTSLYTRPEMYRPESVTVHECGHQFWYALVGNNEFEASWMDEGFNSFTDSEVMFKHYGPSHGTTSYSRIPWDGVRIAPLPGGDSFEDVLTASRIDLPFEFSLRPVRSSGMTNWWRDQPLLTLAPRRSDPRWGDRSGYLRDPDTDPVETFAFEYQNGSSYSTNSYRRTAVALRTLMAVVGRDAFLKGMRHYSETWRYRHPYPEDFYSAFIEGSGEDVSWYFESLFQGLDTVDWEVRVSQKRIPKKKGWFPNEAGELELASKKDEPSDEEAEAESEDDDDEEKESDDKRYLIEIVVQRHGDLILPLPIEWNFKKGDDDEKALERGTHTWTREEQADSNWWRLRFESPVKLESVVLDPERGLYLDGDMSNNQWFADKERDAHWRWGERVFTQYSHLLHWQADIGG